MRYNAAQFTVGPHRLAKVRAREFMSLEHRTQSLRQGARDALRDVARIRETLRPQIKALAADDGFRLRYQNKMLAMILERVLRHTGASMGHIQSLDPQSGRLLIQVQKGFSTAFLQFFQTVEAGHGACGIALQTARRQVVPDILASGLFTNGPSLEILLDANVRAVQSTPLIGESGKVIGVLSTHYRRPREIDIEELRIVDYFARAAADVLDLIATR